MTIPVFDVDQTDLTSGLKVKLVAGAQVESVQYMLLKCQAVGHDDQIFGQRVTKIDHVTGRRVLQDATRGRVGHKAGHDLVVELLNHFVYAHRLGPVEHEHPIDPSQLHGLLVSHSVRVCLGLFQQTDCVRIFLFGQGLGHFFGDLSHNVSLDQVGVECVAQVDVFALDRVHIDLGFVVDYAQVDGLADGHQPLPVLRVSGRH
ncbi:hypothetical protein BpHYR1_035216 [Brachionus plicatilis]|uniref:Uncharacterized protein n=1 Tax=Brachionus plicatilis TaxID=10195 RepID=A0A3M7T987_BRAPC|nr:hypothetical protein BpHYR1_035216 [Brachionus plicatilis]